MIEREKIIELIEDELGNEMFLVDINVSKSNVINVFIDGMNGITIDKCVAISRKIESNLDREIEDFELQVSSAGLGQPFKVIQQYRKNIGKEIEVVTLEGQTEEGILTEVLDNGIKLKVTKKVKLDGEKKKLMVTEERNFGFEIIKTAKAIISFKL